MMMMAAAIGELVGKIKEVEILARLEDHTRGEVLVSMLRVVMAQFTAVI
jgi:hypothetical protein